jgi:hypothetical protein
VPTAARVARNESLYREVNERILELEERFGERERDREQSLASFVCECATTGCAARIELSLDDYRLARSKPERFLIAPGHVRPEFERVVLTTERFWLIEKFGEAGEIAADEAD